MSGFSGYRSGGWLVHLAFSAVLVAVTALAFEHLLRLPLWAGYAAAVPVVVAGWGAGAMLGRPEPGFLFIAAILAMADDSVETSPLAPSGGHSIL